MAEEGGARIRVWDIPVRLFHWTVVVLLPALWWTWKSNRTELHSQLGLVMLALLLFRLLWGVVGSSTARFSSFLKGPRHVGRYAAGLWKGSNAPAIGHNPLGGWSVAILLLLLIAQTVSGLFTQDVDGLWSGPLTPFVVYDTAEAMRHWHGLIFDVLLAFGGLHVAAILFHLLVKRDDLVRPMISGTRVADSSVTTARFAPPSRAALLLLIAAATSWWVSKGCPPFHPAT